MPLRLTLDPEIQALQKAVRLRIDALPNVVQEKKSGVETFSRDGIAFMQLEVRRDHLSIDLWLPDQANEDSRASGIARAHPFLGIDAVKIRFERAADLAHMTRWIEAAYHYAPNREEHRRELEAKAAEAERAKENAAPLVSAPKPLPIELEEKPKRPPPPKRPGQRAPVVVQDDEPSDEDLARAARRPKKAPAPAKKAPKAKARPAGKTRAKAAAKPAKKAKAPKPRAKANKKGRSSAAKRAGGTKRNKARSRSASRRR